MTNQHAHPTEDANTSRVNAAIHNSMVALLDSADDTGCSDDLIVVSRSALRSLAQQMLDDLPDWLDNFAPNSPIDDRNREPHNRASGLFAPPLPPAHNRT